MLVLWLGAAWALDPDGDRHLLPAPGPGADEVASWPTRAGWATSPPRSWPTGGTRFAALVHQGDGLELEAQGLGDTSGPWVPADTTWSDDELAVLVAELGGHYPSARIRVRGEAQRIDWEIRIPADEPRGPAPARPPSVSTALQEIGVVSRETWGSRSTTCTSPEDDWYRFAIHHTAGNQTSSGTVEGAVKALQAYAMDSGGYCDIPYQFLVGYDGSLWEGRPLEYYSGATGGGNNDGNIAVCFLGCYDDSCGSIYSDATDEMMVWARLLVQTLADEHGIVTDDDNTRGHGDWPDNSTACPGTEVKARLDELREPAAPFEAVLVDIDPDPVEVSLDEEVELLVELENTGTETWMAGEVYLAPTPRDSQPTWAGNGWPSDTRAATIDDDVAPGETGTFRFSVLGDSIGEEELGFALVAEWITWFEDIPWGGGPGDDEITVTLVVAEGSGPPGTSGDTGDDDQDRGAAGPPLTQSMSRIPLHTMGRCAVPVQPLWLLGLLPLLARRRG